MVSALPLSFAQLSKIVFLGPYPPIGTENETFA